MTLTQSEAGLAPTLGPQVVDWIHQDAELVHGAGAVQGQRVDWSDDAERLAFVYRAYELHPAPQCPGCGNWHDVPVWDYPWRCPRPKCGVKLPIIRSWTHYKLSRPKGWSKSGAASKLVVVEGCGPSRFDGWDAAGEPVGRPVPRPVINCFATEENQSGETYSAAAYIFNVLASSRWPKDNGYKIDVGIGKGEKSTRTFIHTPDGAVGVAQPRTSSADAAEGGQGTFSVADETHKWTSRVLKLLYETEVMNLGKGAETEGWVLETSTMYQPGKQSVAEESDKAARDGGIDAGICVDHRGAPEDVDVWDDRDKHIPNPQRLEKATRIAYGGAFPWAVNMPQRVRLFRRSNLDQSELERKYLNRKVEQTDAYIYAPTLAQCRDHDLPPLWTPDDGEHVTLGFDGALTDDHTGLVGVHVPTATLFVAGHWDPSDYPTADYPEGHVPEQQVDDTVADAWERWGVSRMYPDPPHWRSWVAKWGNDHGKGVKPFETRRKQRMSPALKALREAVQQGQLRHTGHPALVAHLTRAVLVVDFGREDPELNPDGKWWRIQKPKQTKQDEDVKIDLAVAAVLAWAAYLDAVSAGDEPAPKKRRRVVAW